MHEAKVKGVGVQADEGRGGAYVAVLEVDDKYIPIFIDPTQAQSIQLGLKGESIGRPLTHDLLLDMLHDVGCAIDRVRIDSMQNNTYLAKIDLQKFSDGETETLVFDARSSDAIAVAVRAGCPIEVSDSVLEKTGIPKDQMNVRGFDDDDLGFV